MSDSCISTFSCTRRTHYCSSSFDLYAIMRLLCRTLLPLQVLSPNRRLTTLIVRLPGSVTAAAAANSILVQANKLLAPAAAAAAASGPSSSSASRQQPPFSECHLLAYATSTYQYPQRKPQQGSSNPGTSNAAAGQLTTVRAERPLQ